MRNKLLASAALAASVAFSSMAHADIVIGLVAPLTGPVAAYGDQVKNGAEAAVDQINKNGGILGERSSSSWPTTPAIPSRAFRPPTSSSATACTMSSAPSPPASPWRPPTSSPRTEC